MAKKKGGKKKGGGSRYREGEHATNGKRPRQIPRSATFKPNGPRSQTLPGLEGARNAKLDNLCEAIAECRERMNTARTEEQQLDASALQHMTKKGVTVYRHGGIELARIPGAEKLRVRVTKETGDADESDLEQGDADEGGDEQLAQGGIEGPAQGA